MNTRAKGFIPDPTGHRWTRFKAHAAAKKIADMPGSASVAHNAAPVSDQKTVGQCVAHGVLDTAFAALVGAGHQLPSTFSHRVGYALARAIDRADWVFDGAKLPPLQDDGAQPNQMTRALALYGCPLARDLDDGTLDSIPGLENRELMLHEANVCKFFPLDWLHVGDNDGDKIEQCMAAIASGVPFALAIEAGTQFDACDGSVVLESDGRNHDHMIHAIAYQVIQGRPRFMIQNSWSQSWGAFGRAWVSCGFVENASNILIPRVMQ
jgi:hypothetical protein